MYDLNLHQGYFFQKNWNQIISYLRIQKKHIREHYENQVIRI